MEGSAKIRVSSAAPTLMSILVSPDESSLAVEETQQFTATGTYSDDSTRDISGEVDWESSDAKVATVDADGLANRS